MSETDQQAAERYRISSKGIRPAYEAAKRALTRQTKQNQEGNCLGLDDLLRDFIEAGGAIDMREDGERIAIDLVPCVALANAKD